MITGIVAFTWAAALILLFGLNNADAQQKFKLRFTCGLPITDQFTDGMKQFKQTVESKTNGRVIVEIYPGGELYQHKDVPRVLPFGGIEMAITDNAQLGGLNPIANIVAYQFLIKTYEQWSKARNTIIPIMDKAFNKKNIKFLVPLYRSEAAIAANKMIKVPEDIKGLKIRGPSRAHLDAIEAWGAVGASLSAAEVYDALGKGAIDGATSNWDSVVSRAYYEVVHNFSGPMRYAIWGIEMNLKAWNALPEDAQRVVEQAGKEFEQYTLDILPKSREKAIATLRKAGSNVHFFTPAELEKWTEVTKPTYQKWIDNCVKAGYKTEVGLILKSLDIKGF